MTIEQSLTYFHGALLDEDVEKLLKDEGDFVLHARFNRGSPKPRLTLAVKKKQVLRFEVLRNESGYSIRGNPVYFPNPGLLVEHFQTNSVVPRGESLILKKAIPKGKYQLSHKDIRIMRKIGSGAYGTERNFIPIDVYKGYLMREKLLVAIKRIDSNGKNEQNLIDMMSEARVMQLYDHKNIVKFFGFVVDRAPYLLIMELCPDGSLEDKLRSSGRSVKVSRRIDMSAQAANGLQYLHTKSSIHRDIATRNCLLNGTVLKLADFGMCRATAVYKIDLSKPQNVRWLAPEVWKSGIVNFTTDVYAFGIMLWECFEEPYNPPYCTWKAITVKQRVMAGFRMPVPELMPESVADLMRRCWGQDPNKRPTSTNVFKELDAINKDFKERGIEPPMASTPVVITARDRSLDIENSNIPSKVSANLPRSPDGKTAQSQPGSRPRSPSLG